MELDYPLGHHAKTILRIGDKFNELVDDDIPTDEERHMAYSDDASKKEEQSDDNDDSSDDVGDGNDIEADDVLAMVIFD